MDAHSRWMEIHVTNTASIIACRETRLGKELYYVKTKVNAYANFMVGRIRSGLANFCMSL